MQKVLSSTLGLAEASAGQWVSCWKGENELFLIATYLALFQNGNFWQLMFLVQVARLEKQSAHCAYRWVVRSPSFDSNDVSCLRSRWILPNSTITYDSLPLSHGLGSFDLPSGEWKSEVTLRFLWEYCFKSDLCRWEVNMWSAGICTVIYSGGRPWWSDSTGEWKNRSKLLFNLRQTGGWLEI